MVHCVAYELRAQGIVQLILQFPIMLYNSGVKFSQSTVMTTLPPVYVINLKRNPERRLYIQRQLDSFGLEYQFVEAIDKYDLQFEVDRMRVAQALCIDASLIENKHAKLVDYAKKHGGSALGALAILLSHIKIYDLMVKNDIEQACILEDDTKLLPIFPGILRIVFKLEWDILLLASFSPILYDTLGQREKSTKQRIYFFYGRGLLYLMHQVKHSSILKRWAYQIKHLLEKHDIDFFRTYHLAQSRETLKLILKEFGINPHLHPNRSESVAKILEEHNIRFEGIRKKCKRAGQTILNNDRLNLYTSTRLGVLPEQTSLQFIAKDHYIAEPRAFPLFATAYLVNQSTAMKWKRKVLAPNRSHIDEVPGVLYEEEQVKLRIITPPCATARYNYLVYSVRR